MEVVWLFKTQRLIMQRIESSEYGAFTSADFLDLAPFKTINKSLELLEDDGILRKARRGIYYKPVYNETLGIDCAPGLNDVALAIARQFNWIIIPSGNYALNLIGISTQVPQKIIYVSSGPYREYEVGDATIFFKHSTSKEITALRRNNLIAIQAIKTLGKTGIRSSDMDSFSRFLTEGDKNEIRNGIRITYWIYDVLRKAADSPS